MYTEGYIQPELASLTEHCASRRKAGRTAIKIMHKSLEFLNVTADRPPEDHSDQSVQGWRLLQAGQRAQARECFQAALEHNPDAVGA